jgi:putative flippase GtrA
MKAVSSIVILVLNYVFSKLITFRKKAEAEKKDEE